MKKNFVNLALGAFFLTGMWACQSQKNNLVFEHQGDTLTVVHIKNPSKYLLLPIQESSNEGKVKLVTGSPADMPMDVRLAVDSVEYYVPLNCLKELRKLLLPLERWLQMLYAGSIFSCRIRLIRQIRTIIVRYITIHRFMAG